MSGTASLIVLIALQIRFSRLSASRASSVRSSFGVFGNSAMHGMPSPAASLALPASRSTLHRLTPGSAPIGSSQSRPSQTNKGQMKSLGCSRLSASIERIHALERPRRMRREGNEAVIVSASSARRRLAPMPRPSGSSTSSRSAAAVTSGPAPGPWMTSGCVE